MNIVENNDKIEVLGPMVPSVMICNYVWNQGFSMRLLPMPWSDSDSFFRWVAVNDLGTPTGTPMVFVFTGQFKSRPDTLFHYTTVDQNEAAEIFSDPKRLRVLREDEAPLIPVDPVTGDTGMSIQEYNQWASKIGQLPEGFEVSDVDYSALNKVSLDEFTDMLREAANTSNNNNEENDDD